MYALIYIIGFTIVLISGVIYTIKEDGKLTLSGLSGIIFMSAFSVAVIALFLLFGIVCIIITILKGVTIWEKKD